MKTGKRSGSDNDGSKPRLGVVAALPERFEIYTEHAANLAESALTQETIDLAKLYSTSASAKLHQLLGRRWPSVCGAGLVFPFYLPGASQPHAYRVRPTRPRVVTDRKGREHRVKYDQASEYGMLVYFPPRSRAAGLYMPQRVSSPDALELGAEPAPLAPLYWTEGEKKALYLDQLGLAVVGLTGVTMAGDKAYRDDTHGERLHAHLREHVQVAGREHVIVFDADARSNDHVMQAASKLAGLLLAAGAAGVRFVHPPDADTAKGIDDYAHLHGDDVVRALLATAGPIDAIDPKQPLQTVRATAALREAPLGETLRVPPGYSIGRDGALWLDAQGRRGAELVTHTPMFLTRKLVDVYTGDERVELVFESASTWRTLGATRRGMVDSRAMVAELGPFGGPVTSSNSGKLVDWLDAFEHVNAAAIPRVSCVSTFGWHVIDGERCFASHEVSSREGSQMQVTLDTRGDRRRAINALTPRGALDTHVAALRRAWDADPVCAAVICAAFATPLLEPLRSSNFAVHLPGESSRGKTSMLKIAASVFGDPNDPRWVASWNVTATGAELRAAVQNDLPQCYDEVGGGDPAAVERFVYGLINGGGKTRATRDVTTRDTLSWRTIVISTGERHLADETAATGAQVRVVQLPVAGFGELTAADVDALRDECVANAGSAGAEWIKRLVEGDDDYWLPARASLRTVTALMREQAGDPLQGRVAGYFALLAVTESMLADAFGVGHADGATMHELYGRIGAREPVQPLAVRSRELVEHWVMSDPDAFPELEPDSAGAEQPKSARNGRSRAGFRRRDGMLLLSPPEFRGFCRKNKLDSREVVREWIRLGWSLHDAERLDKQYRLGSFAKLRFYTLLPAADDLQTTELP